MLRQNEIEPFRLECKTLNLKTVFNVCEQGHAGKCIKCMNMEDAENDNLPQHEAK